MRNLIRAGYNITSEDDLLEAATRLNPFIHEKKVTLAVTPENIELEEIAKLQSQLIENMAEGARLKHLQTKNYRSR